MKKNESGATQGVEVLMDKLREGEDDQSTRSRSPQMLSREGPAEAGGNEFGHGDKARKGAHRTEALQKVSTSIPKGA